eukprot:jgi/Mesvir1/12933/Mv05951-RA.1
MIMISSSGVQGGKQNKITRHPDDLDELDDQNASLPMRRRNMERKIKRRESNRQRRWTKLRAISILAGKLVVYQQMIDAGINPALASAPPGVPGWGGSSLGPPADSQSARHLVAQLAGAGAGGPQERVIPSSYSPPDTARSSGARQAPELSMESDKDRLGGVGQRRQEGFRSMGALAATISEEPHPTGSADSYLFHRFMVRSHSGSVLHGELAGPSPLRVPDGNLHPGHPAASIGRHPEDEGLDEAHYATLPTRGLSGSLAYNSSQGYSSGQTNNSGLPYTSGQTLGSSRGTSGREMSDVAADSTRTPLSAPLRRYSSMGNGGGVPGMGLKNRSKMSLYDPEALPSGRSEGGEGGMLGPDPPRNRSHLSLLGSVAGRSMSFSGVPSEASGDHTSALLMGEGEGERGRRGDLNLSSMADGRVDLPHEKATIHSRLTHLGTPIQRMFADVLDDEPPRRRRMRKAKRKLDHFLNSPDTLPAFVVSGVFLALIIISSVGFCLETVEEWKHGTRETVLTVIEYVTIAAFTIEYVLRLLSCQRLGPFVKDPLNAVDLLAILPFYIELIFSSVGDLAFSRQLRLLRIARVFRIMKLGRRFGKLTLVVSAVTDSTELLAMALLLLGLMTIVFSSIIYYAERGDYNNQAGHYGHTNEDGEFVRTEFFSIPVSFWWCIVTLLTVGYGDMVPVTTIGKFVAAVAMICSVVFLALPISVIGANFTQRWYNYGKEQKASLPNLQREVPSGKTLFQRLEMHDEALEEILSRARDIRSDISVLLDYEKRFLRDLEGEKVFLAPTEANGSQHGSSHAPSRTSTFNLSPYNRTPQGEDSRHSHRAPRPGDEEHAAQIWGALSCCQSNDSNIVKCLQAARIKQAALTTLYTATELLRSDRFMQNLDTVYKKYHQLQTLVDEGENLTFDVEELAKLLLETKTMLKQRGEV